MKLELTTIDQLLGMKLEQQYRSTWNEVRRKISDQQGMNLEQYLLINWEWSYNNTYWSTRNEVRKTTTDQHGMKFEQKLLINREWS